MPLAPENLQRPEVVLAPPPTPASEGVRFDSEGLPSSPESSRARNSASVQSANLVIPNVAVWPDPQATIGVQKKSRRYIYIYV